MSPTIAFVLIGLSLASTSSDPAKREDQLSERKCATTYKRMLNFAKYWPPGSNSDYIMYNPGKIGFRGYDLLGDVYYRGCGKADLAPDKVEAAVWYQSAAIAHLPEAQWKLGKMLVEGDGVPMNRDAGLAWLTSAAIEGSNEAAAYLRDHGEPVPAPVSPNSYAVETEQAKRRLEAAQASERQQVIQDLSGLLVTLGTAYVVARASAPQAVATQPVRATPPPPMHSPSVSATPSLTMTRPVFCNSYANATPIGDIVYLRINQFCY